MVGKTRCACISALWLMGIFCVPAMRQASAAVEPSSKVADEQAAQARMDALRKELGTVSTALTGAAEREVKLREQLQKRAEESASYAETLTDEDSQELLAKIKKMSAELDALRAELKTRMEASESFKLRQDALRELHGQLMDTRSEMRRLQQERSRLEVELKTLEEAARADQASQDKPKAKPAAGEEKDE
jgi:septal ring factor EnvC (AmiA/AmiB activator)